MIFFAGYCSLYLSTSFVSVVSYTSERIVLLFPILSFPRTHSTRWVRICSIRSSPADFLWYSCMSFRLTLYILLLLNCFFFPLSFCFDIEHCIFRSTLGFNVSSLSFWASPFDSISLFKTLLSCAGKGRCWWKTIDLPAISCLS